MFCLVLARASAYASNITFDPFTILKCYNTSKGCSAEDILNFVTMGSLPPDELKNVSGTLTNFFYTIFDPEYSAEEYINGNEEANIFLKYTKELTLNKGIYEVMADGDQELLKQYNEAYNQVVKNSKTFARIASTKVWSEKQILEAFKWHPKEAKDVNVEFLLKMYNINSSFYEEARKEIVNVMENHQSIYRSFCKLYGINFNTLSQLLYSIRQMIASDCYNVNNLMKINKKLSLFVDGLLMVQFPDVFILPNDTVNITERIMNIPHLQDVAESILQLCNSFEKNTKYWIELFGESPSKETIKSIRDAVNSFRKGFSLYDILLAAFGDNKEAVDTLLENLKFVYNVDTTPEKLINKFLSPDIVAEYRRFMDIVVNEKSTIKDISNYFESLYGDQVPVKFDNIIQLLRELGNENQLLTKLSILEDYKIEEYIRVFQSNLSHIYNQEMNLIEQGVITQEYLDNIISYLQSEPSVKDFLASVNLSDIVMNINEVLSNIQNNINAVIESIEDEEIRAVMRQVLNITKEIKDNVNYIIENNVTIRGAIEMIPLENISMVYPAIIDSIAKLNETVVIRKIFQEYDQNSSLPFSYDAFFVGLYEMKDITIINIARLIVSEDDLPKVKDFLNNFTVLANSLETMKASEFFNKFFDVSVADFENIYVYVNQFLQFQYIEYLNSTSPSAAKFFGTIHEFISNPKKQYNIDDFDKVLDGLISMATGAERPSYHDSNKKDNTVAIAVGCTVGLVAVIAGVAVGLFIIRKKRMEREDESAVATPLV